MNLFETIEKLLLDGVDPETRAEEIWKKFGKHYAILMIDSSGFTRIVQTYGPLHFVTRLARMRVLSIPILKQHAARIHRFEADNIYAYFDEVDQAAKAALDIHHALRSETITLAHHEPFKICAGIGYGEMLFSEAIEGCFGHEMNLSSKLGEDIADPDQLLMTTAAYNACTLDLKKAMMPREMEISATKVAYYQLDIK